MENLSSSQNTRRFPKIATSPLTLPSRSLLESSLTSRLCTPKWREVNHQRSPCWASLSLSSSSFCYPRATPTPKPPRSSAKTTLRHRPIVSSRLRYEWNVSKRRRQKTRSRRCRQSSTLWILIHQTLSLQRKLRSRTTLESVNLEERVTSVSGAKRDSTVSGSSTSIWSIADLSHLSMWSSRLTITTSATAVAWSLIAWESSKDTSSCGIHSPTSGGITTGISRSCSARRTFMSADNPFWTPLRTVSSRSSSLTYWGKKHPSIQRSLTEVYQSSNVPIKWATKHASLCTLSRETLSGRLLRTSEEAKESSNIQSQ